MRLPTKISNRPRSASLEEQFAPNVDRKWAGDLLLEMRMQGVDGARIGSVLAEVDSHCAESGESAQSAFGDPAVYAASLDLPSNTHMTRDMLRAVFPVMVQLVGMLLILWSFTDWRRGEPFELTAGSVLLAAVLVGEIALLALCAQRVVRFVVKRPVWSVVVFMVHTGILAVPAVLWTTSVAEFQPMWGLGVGTAAMAAGIGWEFIARAGTQTPDDPIESPFDDGGSSREPGGRGKALKVLLTFQTPIVTALFLVITWWFTR
ncbi:hypothetical protein [Zhihengliuella salsuginis]|uniref:Uncharacterized protein n=1 Tax=Zhihengliuella salsuginis TaxID=578222 RepID=A0ABQ3GK67_9MICC|nr:hypothetical protein [Zhihengliuella salsuginis]GHD06398.1 hypothetical protein GCM10008096_16350 [Zhihengliuella salsuginis]